MPEIKNNFAGAKMNKDLDERLVANGEYRHAMNVQVRTTDGDSDGVGDAGTVQNIQGTKEIFSSVHHEEPYEVDNTNKPTVVGSVADEKNNKAYFLVAGLSLHKVINNTTANFSGEKLFIDTIIEVDTGDGTTDPVINPIFVDKYAVTGNAKLDFFGAQNPGLAEDTMQLSMDNAAHLRVGMQIKGHSSGGITEAPIFQAEIQDIIDNTSTGDGYLVNLVEPSSIVDYNNPNFPSWANVSSFVFRSPERVLNFNQDKKISAISLIDDFLFWTDNNDEPKKINIKKCKEGTSNYTSHTQLKLTDPVNSSLLTDVIDIEDSLSPGVNGDVKKENVTVIRRAPRKAPTIEMSASTRDGTGAVTGIANDFLGNDANFSVGDNIIITNTLLSDLNWTFNDILTFTEEIADVENRAVIRATINNYNPADPLGTLDITITSISSNYVPASNIINSGVWTVSLVERNPLFELKMGRFSCRYKYDDGEYSSFGPWSELAFLPGRYDFNHKKGYNLGMVNTVRSLKIKDFIPYQRTRPLDVSEIDILWKTTESPNCYVVKSIKRGKDPEWDNFTLNENNSNNEFGELTITSEMIHKVVEKNQLLRAWDNVPRYALAQEIAANRIVYGNYVQGYDINSAIGLVQNLISDDSPTQAVPQKSVKSIRSYKFGMVFGDKYGRETPVITGGYLEAPGTQTEEMQSGDISVEKEFAAMRNRFQLKQVWDYGEIYSSPDNWIEYVKYYVKETSNEYYNLIMDRWYNAEDGNVWISFASADRNKIDESTYLNLKSTHGQPTPVTENARYKVIAIENEAPNFIKVEPRIMGRVLIGEDDFAADTETGDFGVFSDSLNPDVTTQAPDLLMNNTSLRLSNWNRFLANYDPKGDLKIRIVGVSNTGEKRGPLWRTISYYGTTGENGNTGIIRWRKPFNNSANMISLFNADQNLTTTGLKYYVEFKEDVVVTTQAEFDGKFFVKLEKDTVLEDRVMNFTSEATEYYNSISWLMGYIDSQNTNPASATAIVPGPRASYQWFKESDSGATGAAAVEDGDSGFDEWNNAANNVAGLGQLISQWSNGSGPFSGSLTPQDAGAFLGLGCMNGGGNAYIEGYDNNNSLVNWANHTKSFWSWLKNNVEPNNKTRMFIDSARTKYAKLTGGGNGVTQGELSDNVFYNVDDDGGTNRPLYYYKPTGLDQGYQTGNGFDNTINGEAGRIAISIMNFWGFIGDELAFKNHMTQPGNKFRFNGDPNDRVYQIVGISEEMIDAKNYSLNSTSNSNNTFYQDINSTDTDLQTYQLNSGPTLTNILFGGRVINDTNDCLECQETDDYCYRQGFRVEFREFDTSTGQLRDGGTRGVDLTDWDPRGELCHDGRESTIISSVISNVNDPSAIVPSANAAVFETEPKEDIGLDLYYEASGAIPMNLTSENATDFIPLDCKVTLKSGENAETKVDFAVGINHKVFHVGYHEKDIIVGIKYQTSEEEPAYKMYAGLADITADTGIVPTGSSQHKYFAFEHSNGTETIAKIPFGPKMMPVDKNGDDLSYGVPIADNWSYPENMYFEEDGTLGYTALDSRAEVRFKRTTEWTGFFKIKHEVWKQPITLAWNNCYSFGNGVESDRIRDDFNAPQIDNGVSVSTTFLEFGEEHKKSSLIYSGIFNSTSGVNNLNEFNQAEKITKDINPSYGSIQALKTRDNDIVTFTEDKILKVITNKDALFNADGNAQLTATNRVLGTAIPFSGDYGISNNPESLAWDQFRLYFTDMQRGAVLRLSGNGITPISSVGMKTWFRDNLKKAKTLLGTFDGVNGEYNLTLDYRSNLGVSQGTDTTVSFSEASKGWVSFKSFVPEAGVTIGGKYITAKQSKPTIPSGVTTNQTSFTAWEHNVDIFNDNPSSLNYGKVANRNTFYAPREFIINEPQLSELSEYCKNSYIDVLFNDMPGAVKSFTTVNYEGSQGLVKQFTTEEVVDSNDNLLELTDKEYYNLSAKDGWWVSNITTDMSLKGSVHEFREKEGKWFNKIDGAPRVNVTDKDLNEFSVQGLGYLEGTVENIGTNVVSSTVISGTDNCIVTTETITTTDNGNGTSTVTTETTVTNSCGGTTSTTTSSVTVNNVVSAQNAATLKTDDGVTGIEGYFTSGSPSVPSDG